MFASLKKISAIAQSDIGRTAIEDVCKELSAALCGSVLAADVYGKVIAQAGDNTIEFRQSVDGCYIDSRLTDYLNGITELSILPEPKELRFRDDCFSAAIKPMYASGERLATVVAYKPSDFEEADLILIEVAGTVILLHVRCAQTGESVSKQRDADMVKLAIGALSYSELASVLHIFKELDGSEGLLVASRVADNHGITRSTIISALRKLEIAGVIETRSLGVKGTYLKVINPALLPELYKIS